MRSHEKSEQKSLEKASFAKKKKQRFESKFT